MTPAAVSILPPEVIAAAGRGWRLFPVKAGQKAPPLLPDWPVKASCDTDCLEEWEREFPGANWALACGPDSGVYVLDIDGPDGKASVEAWARRGWNLPETRIHKTSRGQHQLFKWPSGFVFTISAGKLGAGLDERGDRGYILIPPSFHPSGDILFEPFGGSGSTLIACEKTGRRCYMMELSPAYCDVICQRWELATGKKAVLSAG
jgi:hypothetical protein